MTGRPVAFAIGYTAAVIECAPGPWSLRRPARDALLSFARRHLDQGAVTNGFDAAADQWAGVE